MDTLSRREITSRFDEILDFAEIGQFIDQPIKKYSSGMVVRLAFAVQVCVEPDLLIVDEALSVCDVFFQEKCFRRIEQMLGRGMTLIFVSHDANAVRTLCVDAMILDHGANVFCGSAADAVQLYTSVLESSVAPS